MIFLNLDLGARAGFSLQSFCPEEVKKDFHFNPWRKTCKVSNVQLNYYSQLDSD